MQMSVPNGLPRRRAIVHADSEAIRFKVEKQPLPDVLNERSDGGVLIGAGSKVLAAA